MVRSNIFPQRQKSLFLFICLLVLFLSGCENSSTPSTSSSGVILSPFPVISQGRIYVNTGKLHIFDKQTGVLLGDYQLKNPGNSFSSNPIVMNDSIYIIGDTTGGQKSLYALQENNGAIRWQGSFDATSEHGEANGLIYAFSDNHILLALQENNGHIRWQYSIGKDASSGFACFAMTQEIVYICPTDASFAALNAETGTLLWSRNIKNGAIDSGTLASGVLYLSERGGISAHQARNGTNLWSTALTDNIDGNYTTAPVVANNVIYTIACNCTAGKGLQTLYALNIQNGQVLWKHSLRDPDRFGLGSLAVMNDTVLYVDVYQRPYSPNNAGGQDIFLSALRASDGHALWRHQVEGGADPSLNVDHNIVYAVTFDPNRGTDFLHAWQINTGNQVWEQPIPM